MTTIRNKTIQIFLSSLLSISLLAVTAVAGFEVRHECCGDCAGSHADCYEIGGMQMASPDGCSSATDECSCSLSSKHGDGLDYLITGKGNGSSGKSTVFLWFSGVRSVLEPLTAIMAKAPLAGPDKLPACIYLVNQSFLC